MKYKATLASFAFVVVLASTLLSTASAEDEVVINLVDGLDDLTVIGEGTFDAEEFFDDYFGSGVDVDSVLGWVAGENESNGYDDIVTASLTSSEDHCVVDVVFTDDPHDLTDDWMQWIFAIAIDVEGAEDVEEAHLAFELVFGRNDTYAAGTALDFSGEDPYLWNVTVDENEEDVSLIVPTNISSVGDVEMFVVSVFNVFTEAKVASEQFLDAVMSDGLLTLAGGDPGEYPGGDDENGDGIPDFEEEEVEDEGSLIIDPADDVADFTEIAEEFDPETFIEFLDTNESLDRPEVDMLSLTVNRTSGNDTVELEFSEVPVAEEDCFIYVMIMWFESAVEEDTDQFILCMMDDAEIYAYNNYAVLEVEREGNSLVFQTSLSPTVNLSSAIAMSVTGFTEDFFPSKALPTFYGDVLAGDEILRLLDLDPTDYPGGDDNDGDGVPDDEEGTDDGDGDGDGEIPADIMYYIQLAVIFAVGLFVGLIVMQLVRSNKD